MAALTQPEIRDAPAAAHAEPILSARSVGFEVRGARLVSNASFAGAGTLFRDDIGVSTWPFASSASVTKNSVTKTAIKTPRTKSDQADRRVTAR